MQRCKSIRKKNPQFKDTVWVHVHGKRFSRLMRVAGITLELLLLVTVCMFWVGNLYSKEENLSQRQRGLTLFRTNGKKLQTCSKKEVMPLVWPLKERYLLPGGRGKGDKQLKSCEVYNISTNEWQFIGSLNVPRSSGSMVCVSMEHCRGMCWVGFKATRLKDMIQEWTSGPKRRQYQWTTIGNRHLKAVDWNFPKESLINSSELARLQRL